MKSRIGEVNGKKRIGKAYIATFAVLFFLIAVGIFRSGILPLRSVEVAFSDIAPDGLAIVPASCASPAPPYSQTTTTANGTEYLGYEVPPGTNQADTNAINIDEFCITNTGTLNYFYPVGSAPEAADFIYALIRGLPGLSESPRYGPPYTEIGAVDSVSCAANGVTGWADEWSYLSFPPLQVYFYIDNVNVAQVTANVYRAGLGAAGSFGIDNDQHAFAWTIPASYHDGKQHTFAVYAVGLEGPPATEAQLPDSNSAATPTFTCP